MFKHVIAVTGALFVAPVVMHLLGNLKAYARVDAFNHYAMRLREVGYPLFPEQSML